MAYLEQLLDTAIALQDSSDIFDNKYWKPFLTAYRLHIEELKKHWDVGT